MDLRPNSFQQSANVVVVVDPTHEKQSIWSALLCISDLKLLTMKESLAESKQAKDTAELGMHNFDGGGEDSSSSDLSDADDDSPPVQGTDFTVKVHDDTLRQTNSSDTAENVPPTKETLSRIMSDRANDSAAAAAHVRKMGRHRKSRRSRMRAAIVDDTEKQDEVATPRNHYETVLYRRAIRKLSTTATPLDPDESNIDEDGGEIYGDTSLGMKLNVLGGKVIVQSLNALQDGRASPAQLSGMIRCGDVLLQVNEVSLVNLPIDQLMKGLGPLSTPDERTGLYPRKLTLRLASGRGLELLQRSEGPKPGDGSAPATSGAGNTVSATRIDPAADMFSLFPMVDQLSGMPLAGEIPPGILTKKAENEETAVSSTVEPENDAEQASGPASTSTAPLSLEEIIGEKIAEERGVERKKVMSEFFARDVGVSMSLQYTEADSAEAASQNGADEDSFSGLTPAEMIEIGTKALRGAKALSIIMEKVDKGSDRRSFQSLSATLSLYSRASTRRRYVLDGRAMPVNFDKVQEASLSEEDEEDTDDSDKSTADSDEGEQLDGDELLVQLAATDEIWRKQVLDFLEQVIEQSLDETSDDSVKDANMDLSNELGSFLFGANMTEVLKRQKRSHALPPPEITSLLFDLTTKISSSVPDRIKAEGDPITVRSSLVPFIGMKRPSAGSNIMLANHFMLDQVLPLWLKSFRPLPLDQRRILWPLERSQNLESTAGSTITGDDITVDSMNTKTTATGSQLKTRKNLREQIEDNELDPESRAETCFLTTYYFTQFLLPRMLSKGHEDASKSNQEVIEEVGDFISQFGSYLRLHTCLAYAAVLKSSVLIDALLEVAKFDPRHREVMKQTSRASALVIYDSTMLSAVVRRINDIRSAPSPERRRATINLCYQAYPDLRPWQVKKECVGLSSGGEKSGSEKELANLYYEYLSLLLHPSDGHEGARHDPALVMEYCTLSIQGKTNAKRRRHFLQVASRTSSDHLAYVRDLPLLLNLSMDAKEYDLALDLAAEILDTNTNLNLEQSLRVLVGYVTDIGRRSVDTFIEDHDRGTRVLKRVIRLYNRISMLGTDAAKSVVDIPLEMITLLRHADGDHGSSTTGLQSKEGVIDLVKFLAAEARPIDVLMTLIQWCTPTESNKQLYPVYQIVLKNGIREGTTAEMSGSLLRLMEAHSSFEQTVQGFQNATTVASFEHDPPEEPLALNQESLWIQLSHGMLDLKK